mgnify:CR=1 FL=1
MAQQQHSLNTGRNLPVATAVGLLLLGSIIASLVYSPVVFAVLAAAMGAMGAMVKGDVPWDQKKFAFLAARAEPVNQIVETAFVFANKALI